jgi:hypothetical protein
MCTLPSRLQQETQLIAQIKERVWEEAFEQKAYTLDYPKLRSAIQHSLVLQHELLTSRACLREVRLVYCFFFMSIFSTYLIGSITRTHKLTHARAQNLTTAAEANLLMLSRGLARPPSSTSALRGLDDKGLQHAMVRNDHQQPPAAQTPASRWLHRASTIFAKTGISEPDLFFHKLENCRLLKKQMTELKKTAELKLADMKDKQHKAERDLYDEEGVRGSSRSDASITGSSGVGGTTSAEEPDSSLELQVRAYKHAQEKAAVAMLTEQRAREGIKHIAEVLGHQEQEGEGPLVDEMMRHIEAVLAELTQRQQGQQQGEQQGEQGASEMDAVTSRYPPSEKLQRALASFQQFKSLDIPRRNSFEPNKSTDQAAITFTINITAPIPEKN